MPKKLDILNSGNAIHIATKADLKKLKIKHAVIGVDLTEIEALLDKIEGLPGTYSKIQQYVVPHRDLTDAIKAFKSAYGRKHPKFTKALEDDILAPVAEIIDEGARTLKMLSSLPEQFIECANFVDQAISDLARTPVDDAVLGDALEKLAPAGSLFTNGVAALRQFGRDFQIGKLEKLAEVAKPYQPQFDELCKVLTIAKKQKQYDVDLVPVVGKASQLHKVAMKIAKAMDKV